MVQLTSSSNVIAFPAPESVPAATCRHVASRVAIAFGLDVRAIVSTGRGSPPAAFARQVAMYLAHVGFALSFERIGRQFGRDRTTVSHACRVIEDRRDDDAFDRLMSGLEASCRAVIVGDRVSAQGGVR